MKNEIKVEGKAKIGTLNMGLNAPADSDAALLKALSEGVENKANFGELEAEDVNVGVHLRAPIRTNDELNGHIETLAATVDAAEKAGELPAGKATEAKAALETVKAEAKKPKPASERVLGGLKRVSEILDEVKKSSESVEKVGKFILKAAPYAAAVYTAARAFFGLP